MDIYISPLASLFNFNRKKGNPVRFPPRGLISKLDEFHPGRTGTVVEVTVGHCTQHGVLVHMFSCFLYGMIYSKAGGKDLLRKLEIAWSCK